ncbi:hypothetical protein FKM82_020701 [Ascaphus truei]
MFQFCLSHAVQLLVEGEGRGSKQQLRAEGIHCASSSQRRRKRAVHCRGGRWGPPLRRHVVMT